MRIAWMTSLDPGWQHQWAGGDKARILGYLLAGRVLRDGGTPVTDLLDPERRPLVPVGWFTDGTWIWPEAVIYHAAAHDIPVDAYLVDHIRSVKFEPAAVSDAVASEALAVLRDAEQTATPYVWCQRYAAGEVSRADLIEVLGRYDYVPSIEDREWNEAIVQPPGTIDEIEQAGHASLIDIDLYGAIYDRLRS